jgi:hypothetical protein
MDAASKEVLVASNGNSTESEIEAQNSHDIQVSADHLQLQGENNQSEGACPLCFLSPCVGSASPGWLCGGQAAHAANSPIRRVIYGKYWKIICNLGGWTSPLYLAKKLTESNGVLHMREIMPDCVVRKVRSLYPNPTGTPYMGHKWE